LCGGIVDVVLSIKETEARGRFVMQDIFGEEKWMQLLSFIF
jgi:hypothetical protein